MKNQEAIQRMKQINARLAKISGETDKLLRMINVPPPMRFDYEVDAPISKRQQATSLGLSADAPVPKAP